MTNALPTALNPFAFFDKIDKVLDKLADKLEKAKPVSLDNGVLHFNKEGDYTFEFLSNGKVKILLNGGQATVLTAQEWGSVNTFDLAKAETDLHLNASILVAKTITGLGDLEITHLGFTQASALGGFETSVNLDTAIGSMLAARGIEATLESLTVDGTKADAFKLLWDYLDDAYVAGNNYYNLPLNESFVRLGVEYVEYLQHGGAPLTDVLAKFTADGSDAGFAPDRAQSIHDNLLGNFNATDFNSRFTGQVKADLLALIDSTGIDLLSRPVFSGNEGADAAYDAARAFDYDQGWKRSDYIDHALSGTVDLRATNDGPDAGDIGDGTEMIYGDGNTVNGWNIVRHEGAGAELALNIKHRGGANYEADHQDANGTAHYYVSEGSQTGNAGRAEWNFDFAGTELQAADNDTLTFKLFVDIDETAKVKYVEYTPDDNPASLYSVQNSGNYAFLSSLIDADNKAPGHQAYAFGEGTFDIELRAYDSTPIPGADAHKPIAVNHIVVHVDNDLII